MIASRHTAIVSLICEILLSMTLYAQNSSPKHPKIPKDSYNEAACEKSRIDPKLSVGYVNWTDETRWQVKRFLDKNYPLAMPSLLKGNSCWGATPNDRRCLSCQLGTCIVCAPACTAWARKDKDGGPLCEINVNAP